MSTQSIQSTTTSASWDPVPVKRSLKTGADTLLDVTASVAVVGIKASGECAKLSGVGATCAPVIDVSTGVVAPAIVEAAKESLKPLCHNAIDSSVDGSQKCSAKSTTSC